MSKNTEKGWEYTLESLYTNAAEARERYMSTTDHVNEVIEREQMIRKRDELYDFVRQLELDTIEKCEKVARSVKNINGLVNIQEDIATAISNLKE